MNNNRYLVLSVSRFDFENEGQKIKGSKVTYLPTFSEIKDNQIGAKPISINASYESFDLFKDGAGIYDLGFQIVPGQNGAPKMLLTSARCIKVIDITKISDDLSKLNSKSA